MAANSKREQIIVANQALVDAVASIKSVVRKQPMYSELQDFAQTQFPVAAVVGRLPVPQEKHSGRKAEVDLVVSGLKVDVFVYLQVNKDVDTAISNLLDDLWTALYADQLRSGLVIETVIKAKEKINVWAPFAAFQITAEHKYVHDTGGI